MRRRELQVAAAEITRFPGRDQAWQPRVSRLQLQPPPLSSRATGPSFGKGF